MKDVVPILIELLSHQNNVVRGSAALGLGYARHHAKAALPNLLRALSDKDNYVRGNAAGALFFIGAPAKSVVPALLNALNANDDPLVHHSIVLALGAFEPLDKTSVPALIVAASHKSNQLRLSAFRILGDIGRNASAAIPVLRAALMDEAPGIVESAQWALDRIVEKQD